LLVLHLLAGGSGKASDAGLLCFFSLSRSHTLFWLLQFEFELTLTGVKETKDLPQTLV
jgi:hypothetical protein